MNALDLWTRVAILVLELGSIVVFGWFLAEVTRLWRHGRRRGGPSPRSGPPADGPGEAP